MPEESGISGEGTAAVLYFSIGIFYSRPYQADIGIALKPFDHSFHGGFADFGIRVEKKEVALFRALYCPIICRRKTDISGHLFQKTTRELLDNFVDGLLIGAVISDNHTIGHRGRKPAEGFQASLEQFRRAVVNNTDTDTGSQ